MATLSPEECVARLSDGLFDSLFEPVPPRYFNGFDPSANPNVSPEFAQLRIECDSALSRAKTLENSLSRSQSDLTLALAERYDAIKDAARAFSIIVALKAELAAFRASNVPPDDPKPLAHNPFKADDRDPRLMGTPQRLA